MNGVITVLKSIDGISLCTYADKGSNKLMAVGNACEEPSNEVCVCFVPHEANMIFGNDCFGDGNKVVLAVGGKCGGCGKVVLAILVYDKEENELTLVSKTESKLEDRVTKGISEESFITGNIIMELTKYSSGSLNTNDTLYVAYADMIISGEFKGGNLETDTIIINRGNFNFGSYYGVAVVGSYVDSGNRVVRVLLAYEENGDEAINDVMFSIGDKEVAVSIQPLNDEEEEEQ